MMKRVFYLLIFAILISQPVFSAEKYSVSASPSKTIVYDGNENVIAELNNEGGSIDTKLVVTSTYVYYAQTFIRNQYPLRTDCYLKRYTRKNKKVSTLGKIPDYVPNGSIYPFDNCL